MKENDAAAAERVKEQSAFVQPLKESMSRVIVGQEYLVERLILGLLADGHILVESVPGLAKTLSITTLSKSIDAQFSRIQFTPDLLPADIVGTLIYNAKEGIFDVKKGPVFANIVLADEINRAPGKVQAALLEAMQERQVTIGDTSYALEDPFLVMATQNPIEQEGTYPLPEAQIDRFLMKVKITYPSESEELGIMTRMGIVGKELEVNPVTGPDKIIEARKHVNDVYLDDRIKEYIVKIVFATRYPAKYGLEKIGPLVQMGASPRASIAMMIVSKTYAFMGGRAFVTPQDIKDIGFDVLRHRIIRSYEAEAEEMPVEDIIQRIFDKIEIP